MNAWRTWSIASLVATTVACAGYGIPPQHLVNAENAIAAARGSGAARDPSASEHLKLAEQQYANARQLMASGDEKQADLLLLQSQADAQLAQSLAKKATATGGVDRIQELVEASAPSADKQQGTAP